MIRLIEPVNISDEYEKGYEDGYKVGRAEGAPKGRWIVKDFIPCSFQMHPGRQAFISSRSTETRSALKRDGFLLELTGWTKASQGS